MTLPRGVIALLAVGLLALVGGHVGLSGATFSAQKSNPGNTLTAATSFPGIRVASGTYTGNGTDNRTITGVGFQPDAVIVKASTALDAPITTEARSVMMSVRSSIVTALARSAAIRPSSRSRGAIVDGGRLSPSRAVASMAPS